MIKAKATQKDGSPIILLGLSEENIKRLKKGQPILVKKEELEIKMDMIIIYGDEKDIAEALMGVGFPAPH